MDLVFRCSYLTCRWWLKFLTKAGRVGGEVRFTEVFFNLSCPFGDVRTGYLCHLYLEWNGWIAKCFNEQSASSAQDEFHFKFRCEWDLRDAVSNNLKSCMGCVCFVRVWPVQRERERETTKLVLYLNDERKNKMAASPVHTPDDQRSCAKRARNAVDRGLCPSRVIRGSLKSVAVL